MSQQNEYEGPRFTAHDGRGAEYVLTPVYRRNDNAEGNSIGEGYEETNLIRIWAAGGEPVRRDGPGRYTILSSHSDAEISLTSKDAKAI